jgi:hypothetical protein
LCIFSKFFATFADFNEICSDYLANTEKRCNFSKLFDFDLIFIMILPNIFLIFYSMFDLSFGSIFVLFFDEIFNSMFTEPQRPRALLLPTQTNAAVRLTQFSSSSCPSWRPSRWTAPSAAAGTWSPCVRA